MTQLTEGEEGFVDRFKEWDPATLPIKEEMMKEPRIPLKSGDEMDALSRCHTYFHWAAGVRKRIKRGYRKRVRRQWRETLGKGKDG